MKILYPFLIITFIPLGFLLAGCKLFTNKSDYRIETADIRRFWTAFDSLKQAHTAADSATIIQRLYLDNMSLEGKKFIEIREYTADEYVRTIRKYPLYFASLRPVTLQLDSHRAAMDSTFKRLQAAIPGYDVPDVCFAIGCFRGGGTTKKDVILIGAEIALADSTMNTSEFKGNLYKLLSTADGDISGLIAHESIHCQQRHGQNRTLLSIALQEGAAGFLPGLILHTNINKNIKAYAITHECELWQQFKKETNSNDLSQWFFNTSTIKNKPADLGYVMGMRICQAYYNNQPDKQKAIAMLLDRSKYLQVMEESGYNGNCVTPGK